MNDNIMASLMKVPKTDRSDTVRRLLCSFWLIMGFTRGNYSRAMSACRCSTTVCRWSSPSRRSDRLPPYPLSRSPSTIIRIHSFKRISSTECAYECCSFLHCFPSVHRHRSSLYRTTPWLGSVDQDPMSLLWANILSPGSMDVLSTIAALSKPISIPQPKREVCLARQILLLLPKQLFLYMSRRRTALGGRRAPAASNGRPIQGGRVRSVPIWRGYGRCCARLWLAGAFPPANAVRLRDMCRSSSFCNTSK